MSNSLMLGSPVHQPSAEYTYPKAFLEVAEHPSSLELIELWRTFEKTGGMRMGRDIPSRIKAKFLPNLVVVEPIGDWTDGHIRLAGSLLMERFGREIQGMLISELYAIYPAMGDMLVESARRSEKTRKPGILSARICAGSVELMRFEAVGLPVFAPDGIAQWNLVGVFRF